MLARLFRALGLYRAGLSWPAAWEMAPADPDLDEVVIGLGVLLAALVAVALVDTWTERQEAKRLELSQARRQIAHLERVIVDCLNGTPIRIDHQAYGCQVAALGVKF